MTTKDLITISPPSLRAVEALMEATAGDEPLSASDLPIVKMPASGSQIWEVPSGDGVDPVKEISGILLHHQSVRSYWIKEAGDGDNSPPDCASSDGSVGVPNTTEKVAYGGACEECPMSQWGSSTKSPNGKACKQMKNVFLLQEGKVLPLLVRIPPSSLRTLRQYLILLASEDKRPWDVVTTLSLEKAQNATGQVYSHLVVSASALKPNDAIGKFREQMLPALAPTPRRAAIEAAE